MLPAIHKANVQEFIPFSQNTLYLYNKGTTVMVKAVKRVYWWTEECLIFSNVMLGLTHEATLYPEAGG